MTAFTTNRYNFTSIFFGFLAITSLGTLAVSSNLNTIVQIGLLAVSIIATALIFLVPYGKVSLITNIVGGKLEITGDEKNTYFVFPKTLEGENKKIKTLITLNKPLRQFEDVTNEEQIIRDKLSKIFEEGLTTQSLQHALELCETFKPNGLVSFRYPLNKARFLGLLGRTAEAENIAQQVIKDYENNNEAIAAAYELLDWVQDFSEPNKENIANSDILYQKWLKKRKIYVAKGLEYFQRHQLLMNAFEISVLEKNAKEAMTYLKKAFLANDGKTQAKLVVNPILQEAKNLSLDLGNMIQEIINGDFNMNTEPDTNMFYLLRKQMLFIFLITLVALILLSASYRFPIKSQSLDLLPRITIDLVHLKKAGGGTEIEKLTAFSKKAGGGTEIEKLTAFSKKAGGGTEIEKLTAFSKKAGGDRRIS
jgi:tetratricopeptide (TPR) repeat protein